MTKDTPKPPLPPYVPFKTFKNFIQKMHELTVVPDAIDSSVLRSYAGSVARQIVSALKYLRLIQDNGTTTDRLRELVGAFATDGWGEKLSALIFDVYQPIVGILNLDTATSRQLNERFKEAGADGEVLAKCVTFFTQAVADSGLTLSPHITARNQRSKSDRTRNSSKKPREDKKESDRQGMVEQPPQAGAVKFSVPVPEKGSATIFIPADLTSEDWEMIDIMMRAYISRLQKGKKEEA